MDIDLIDFRNPSSSVSDLSKLTHSSRLYLIGHCLPGMNTIFSDEVPASDGKSVYPERHLSVNEIVNMLVENAPHLKNPSPSGQKLTISLIACHGGVNKTDGSHITPSFAEQLVKALADKGIQVNVLARTDFTSVDISGGIDKKASKSVYDREKGWFVQKGYAKKLQFTSENNNIKIRTFDATKKVAEEIPPITRLEVPVPKIANLNNIEAEKMLKGSPNGTGLVHLNGNQYILSCNQEDIIKHIPFSFSNNIEITSKIEFYDIKHLISADQSSADKIGSVFVNTTEIKQATRQKELIQNLRTDITAHRDAVALIDQQPSNSFIIWQNHEGKYVLYDED